MLTRKLAAPDLDELAEAAAEKAAADARAVQREQLLMANRAAGDPLGQVSRYQAAVSELRGEVMDLETQLEAARGRLNRAARTWCTGAIRRRRSVPPSRGAATRTTCWDRRRRSHAEYVAASRAAIAAMAAGTPRRARRPFGGVVRRSEVTCHECQAAGANPEESWLIHHDPDAAIGQDLIDLGEMTVAAFGRQDPADAERRTYGYAEISR